MGQLGRGEARKPGSWPVVSGPSPFTGTCQLSLFEWLESSHRAVCSRVPGPGDAALTGRLPLSSLAAATSLPALEAAGAADIP